MNYGKRGVSKIQKSLTSKTIKFKKLFFVTALKVMLTATLSIMIVGACFGIGAFKGILSTVPDIDPASVLPQGFATVVYDAKGNELTKLVAANSNRSYEKMDRIPKHLADAFVAVEDERFYDHNGIDIRGILRAAFEAVQNFELTQGASTITQQIIKNNVFDDWVNEETMQKIKRKIQEQYLAVELEKKMSKEQILEIYMSTINLGQNTLGVKAAALRYFNKQPYQLTLSESAVIVATTSNPSKYNPISHPEKNEERRQIVLDKMKKQGYISQAEYDEAMADDVYSRILAVNEEIVDSNSVYTYFVDEVTRQVLADLSEIKGFNETQAHWLLFSGGLSIYTTLDPDIQAICDEIYADESNYPETVKWYLNYVLTIKKANGEKENHSTEMFKAYYKQQNASFNLIYDTKEDAYAAIEAYKDAMMSEGDQVDGERISLTPQPQVSITVEEQSTGYVVAMIGGRGVKEASRTLNRASNTTRQPGSTFKVVSTYAPALDSAGLTLADVQNDAPLQLRRRASCQELVGKQLQRASKSPVWYCTVGKYRRCQNPYPDFTPAWL